MPRYIDANGKGTNDEKAAARDPKSGEPVANPARNLWVTSTSLTSALFAESTALFAIVMGIAMLLTGLGFATRVGSRAHGRRRCDDLKPC